MYHIRFGVFFFCFAVVPILSLGSAPARKISVKLKLISCKFLRPPANEITVDPYFLVYIDGTVASQSPSKWYGDQPNPQPNWEQGFFRDLTINSVIEYRVFDYNKEDESSTPTEKFQVSLPYSALSWNVSQFGHENKYGEPATYHLLTASNGISSTGECDVALQIFAEECNLGEYVVLNEHNEHMFCGPCPAGNKCTDKVTKNPCSAGTFTDTEGNTECETCPKGTYQNVEGQTSCENCPVAEYQDQTGQSACKRCDRGTFANSTGSSECTPCAKGTVQPFIGQDFCVMCLPGKYQDETGGVLCKKCPAGTFGSSEGSKTSECDGKCAAGHFCPQGSTDAFAHECGKNEIGGEGLYCPTGSESPLSCPEGYYTTGDTPSTRSAIVLCEPGYACPGDGGKIKCEEQLQKFSNLPGQSECITCGDCSVNEYRSGCTNTSLGVCLACRINETNADEICGPKNDYEACKGNTISDVSRCKKPPTSGIGIGVVVGIGVASASLVGVLSCLGIRHRKKLKKKLKDERSRSSTDHNLNSSLALNVNPILGQHVKGVDNTENERRMQELDDHNKKLQDELRRLKRDEQEKAVLSNVKVLPRRKMDIRKEFEVNLEIEKT